VGTSEEKPMSSSNATGREAEAEETEENRLDDEDEFAMLSLSGIVVMPTRYQ
jgi:hypothetical protein